MPYEDVVATPLRAEQKNEVAVSGEVDASRPMTVLHLPSGQKVVVPTAVLLGNSGPAAERVGRTESEGMASPPHEQVIPLVAEEAHFEKKTVTTGTVRLHRDTETFTGSARLPITRTTWEVERTPVGRLYSEKPEVWQEDDVTVYPLVEERIVAKREYFVVEEVRVRRVAVTTERTASVELKRDVLTVERDGVPVDGTPRG